MILIAFILGLALPATVGWLALRVLEGSTPVLARWERWAAAVVLGPTLSMFMIFVLSLAGMPLTRLTFLLTFLVLITLQAIPAFTLSRHPNPNPNPNPSPSPSPSPSTNPNPTPLHWLTIALGTWIAIKIVTAAFLLIASPPYSDDVINNWNFRGMVFYHAQEFTLELQRGYGVVERGNVSSYPPAVPLMKTWFAALYGEWNEGLVNAMHIVWYLCALALLFFALRRMTTLMWSVIGTYMLSSIPLYLMHGTLAYADLFLSLHVFLVVAMLLHALREDDEGNARAYLSVGALALALLPFTKNEGLILYFPSLIIAVIGTLFWLRRRGWRIIPSALWYIGLSAVVLIPWLGFKLMNDLPFGNAKAVSGFEFGWQPGVLKAIAINTFMEGNWLLLMPLFLGLLLWKWRTVFRSPLILPVLFILTVWAGQIVVFLFTSISNEAIYQTGYARGLLQLLPVMVMVTTMLLAATVQKWEVKQ